MNEVYPAHQGKGKVTDLHAVCVSRDLGELGGHPSGAMEAAVAGERDAAVPHPPPGRQRPAGRPLPHRRHLPGHGRPGAPPPAHLCHGEAPPTHLSW